MGRISARGVDDRTVERFKKYVLEKYGKLYGCWGQEIGEAMKEYLKKTNYEDARAHTHKPKAHKPKEYKKANPQNEENKRNLMYASYDEPGDNDGESDVEKLLDPNEPGIPPSEKTKRRIIRHLKRTGMLDAERINENAVKRVIGMEAGYDPRTINKYFNILEDEYLLSHIEYVNIRDSKNFGRVLERR